MRRFFRALPLALAWLLLCQLLWGWVFVNFLTDTAPENIPAPIRHKRTPEAALRLRAFRFFFPVFYFPSSCVFR